MDRRGSTCWFLSLLMVQVTQLLLVQVPRAAALSCVALERVLAARVGRQDQLGQDGRRALRRLAAQPRRRNRFVVRAVLREAVAGLVDAGLADLEQPHRVLHVVRAGPRVPRPCPSHSESDRGRLARRLVRRAFGARSVQIARVGGALLADILGDALRVGEVLRVVRHAFSRWLSSERRLGGANGLIDAIRFCPLLLRFLAFLFVAHVAHLPIQLTVRISRELLMHLWVVEEDLLQVLAHQNPQLAEGGGAAAGGAPGLGEYGDLAKEVSRSEAAVHLHPVGRDDLNEATINNEHLVADLACGDELVARRRRDRAHAQHDLRDESFVLRDAKEGDV
mmetsp:Transcript_32350/g.67767  ORF Transcript_32350/g.67767 Transcript_32350/m.67767 type:complete len:336 (-) Transcript_32350:1668-2675(-)